MQLWVIGFSFSVFGSVLDFVAFGMAPMSLLAPLAALTLVWNLLIAPRFNGERVTREALVATVIICAGVTSSVITAPHSTPSYSVTELISLLKRSLMVVYGIIVASFLFVAYLATIWLDRIERF